MAQAGHGRVWGFETCFHVFVPAHLPTSIAQVSHDCVRNFRTTFQDADLPICQHHLDVFVRMLTYPFARPMSVEQVDRGCVWIFRTNVQEWQKSAATECGPSEQILRILTCHLPTSMAHVSHGCVKIFGTTYPFANVHGTSWPWLCADLLHTGP